MLENRGWWAFLLAALWCAAAGAVPIIQDDVISVQFHIIANVDSVHEVVLDGRTCQFSYRSANTAHGEAWTMKIERERSGEFKCTIEDIDPVPPHATFYGFSAHMFGARNDVLTSNEVWSHEGVLLEQDGYLVEGNTLRADSHWNLGGLSKVIISSE
ncbi:hypothetical protein T484DRAFT_1967454 [Baffinella frigidus]|nr:hypothetical protein T484DRAFT_1967454 [Cryptophyta sp. CCMP2293]